MVRSPRTNLPINPLPKREGARPETTPWAPHIQLDQVGPTSIMNALTARVFALPDVEERRIYRAAPPDPPERATWLRDEIRGGPTDAFIQEREIGHFHPWDRSMHIALPPGIAEEAVTAGWAEVHPVARAGAAPINLVMIYAARDGREAETLFELIQSAYYYAGGRRPTA